MVKILVYLLIFLLAVAGFLVAAKDWILKTVIEQTVTGLTGFKAAVKQLQYDFPSTLRIQDLEIRNPKGFKNEVFTNIPEIYISLVLSELLQGKRTHLSEVRLNIQEIHVEKNAQGVSNMELLSSVGGKKGKIEKKQQPLVQPSAPPKSERPPMPFLLERLELTIRKVSYEDHSGVLATSPLPKKLVWDLNVDRQVFTHIQSPQAVVNLIVFKILSSATLGRLLELDPRQLIGEDVQRILSSSRELVGKQTALLRQQIGNVAAQGTSFVSPSELSQKAEALLQDSAAKERLSSLLAKIKSLQTDERTS